MRYILIGLWPRALKFNPELLLCLREDQPEQQWTLKMFNHLAERGGDTRGDAFGTQRPATTDCLLRPWGESSNQL